MSNYICAICRDFLEQPVDLAQVYEDSHQQVLTFCGHFFHNFCISEWLDTLVDANAALTCPTCYRKIEHNDIIPIYPTNGGQFEDYISLLCDLKRRTKILTKLCDQLDAENVKFFQIVRERNELIRKIEKQNWVASQLNIVIDSRKEELGRDSVIRALSEIKKKYWKNKIEVLKNRTADKQRTNHNSKLTLDAMQKLLKDFGIDNTSGKNVENEKVGNIKDSSKGRSSGEIANSEEILGKIKRMLVMKDL